MGDRPVKVKNGVMYVRCCNCETFKQQDEFPFSRRNKHQCHSYCKVCTSRLSKWAKKKHLYGITKQEFDNLKSECNGSCQICDTHYTKTPENKLYIDHNHTTRQVRGLLCSHCNKALGLFRENVESLKNAMSYLRCGSGKVIRKEPWWYRDLTEEAA